MSLYLSYLPSSPYYIGHTLFIELDTLVLRRDSYPGSATLQNDLQMATEDLDIFCRDEQFQPITYNHSCTDNVQKDRQEPLKKMVRQAMSDSAAEDRNGKLHVSNIQFDAAKLLSSLQSHINVDMDTKAYAEALSGLDAYCKCLTC